MTLRYRFALSHLFISSLIALLSAILVFYGWYAFPYSSMLNVGPIFLMLILIDVICGPLFTLFLATPNKSKRMLYTDIALIGVIQLIALIYGLYTLHQARPVMTVFNTDAFHLIQASDIPKNELIHANELFKPLKFSGTRMAHIHTAQSEEEKIKRIEQLFNGVDINASPADWQSYKANIKPVIEAAKPINTLIKKYENKADEFHNQLSKLKTNNEHLYYVPFLTNKSTNWVAIIDENANILGYIPLNQP